MPKTSRDATDKVVEFPDATDRTTELLEYTAGFTTIHQDSDLAPILASLPGGHCSCPHWGYMFSGRMTVTYADRTEVFEAGDAFYMPPGHVPKADADTDFVMFSPSDELAATEAAIMAAMQAANNT